MHSNCGGVHPPKWGNEENWEDLSAEVLINRLNTNIVLIKFTSVSNFRLYENPTCFIHVCFIVSRIV